MSGPSHQPHSTSVALNTRTSAAVAESRTSVQVLDFINSRLNFERLPVERYDLQDFKLERMRELLRRLGDPQESLPAVHIAGTKGKGSTAAMTAAILSASGRRVGLFTSPHLESIGERMTIDGRLPSDVDLQKMMEVVPPIVQEMDTLGPSMRPTFFECITAMAWVHFRRYDVDFVVLEVGLGGRLDATNVCSPLVTVITSISRDHERLLGSTLSEIAAEKGGIFKPGVPVISGVLQSEPREVIRQIAATRKSPLFELDREIHSAIVDTLSSDSERTSAISFQSDRLLRLTIESRSPWGKHQVRVPLPGQHQARNTALALGACDLIAQDRFVISDEVIRQGFDQLRWPLRIETLRRHPLVIVDAAHNDGSIESLIETLASLTFTKRLLIFATSRDKDAPGMLRQLNTHFDQVILTQFVNNPRAVPVDVLASMASECLTIPFQTAASPLEAWKHAQHLSGDDDLICSTGSFFLATEMRTIILADSQSEL